MTIIAQFRRNWLISTFGILLFFLSAWKLYKNEGEDVSNTLSLQEALADIISLNANEEIEANLEGRMVYLTGPIITGQPLTEPDYNIQVQAVKLRRRVYMYQWVEETVEQNFAESVSAVETDTKTYYYTQQWREEIVDSRQFYNPFGHKNPQSFPIAGGVQTSDAVYIGRYELGDEAKNKFNKYQQITSDTRPDDAGIKMHMGYYYHSNDVYNPQIGDLRLSFSFAGLEGDYYSIVGKLENKKIVPFRTSHGVNVLLVYEGEHSLNSIYRQERHQQRIKTWIGRIIGLTIMFFAVTCTSKLLNILLTNSQVFGFLAPERHESSGNILLSISLALVIASIAWILHRPLFAGLLLIVAGAPYLWGVRGFISYDPIN